MAEAKSAAEYATILAQRQAARAKERADSLEADAALLGPRPKSRTPEEWAHLKAGARRMARARDVAFLRSFLSSHSFRPEDIATVLFDLGILKTIVFECREGFVRLILRGRQVSRLQAGAAGLRAVVRPLPALRPAHPAPFDP